MNNCLELTLESTLMCLIDYFIKTSPLVFSDCLNEEKIRGLDKLSVNSIRVDSVLRVDLKLQESTLHREKTFMNSTSAGRQRSTHRLCGLSQSLPGAGSFGIIL
jgi:hypothetical protein